MKKKLINVIKLILRCKNFISRSFFTSMVKIKCQSYLSPLTVNNNSNVSKNTVLGKNVSFNGMEILGAGMVNICDKLP